MVNNDSQHIVKILSETDYASLFYYSNKSSIDSVWQNGKNQKKIEKIVTDSKYSNYVRFLASEILFEKMKDYPPDTLRTELAKIYTEALMRTGGEVSKFRLSGNAWGLLYELDDVGILGKHLISFGIYVIPYLINLLDNTEVVYYEGSKEATLGNSYKLRIKDFSAFFLGKIKTIPLKYYANNDERDLQIGRLKETLKIPQNEQ